MSLTYQLIYFQSQHIMAQYQTLRLHRTHQMQQVGILCHMSNSKRLHLPRAIFKISKNILANHSTLYLHCFLFLGLTKGYVKKVSSYCNGVTIKGYDNLTEAIRSCNNLGVCTAVYDYQCGKGAKYELCLRSSGISHSPVDSCIYVRGSIPTSD